MPLTKISLYNVNFFFRRPFVRHSHLIIMILILARFSLALSSLQN